MKIHLIVSAIFGLFVVRCPFIVNFSAKLFTTTGERIARHGYPWERHTVVTDDGYILDMFRIPHSKSADNQMAGNKSAVLLLHGMMTSSDIFVMAGPETDLAFMMADAGYDVWLGNARGNEYSRKHNSTSKSSYWAFSWHEMGYYDMPAMIDYISSHTGQNAVHFVGHSQGTTAFMVMLATRPSYNGKIKTSHLLGPAIFRSHIKSTIIKALVPIMGKAHPLNTLLSATIFLPGNAIIRALLSQLCKVSPNLEWCAHIACLIVGGPSPYTNRTLMADFLLTYPTDSSTAQHMHYMQEYLSGKFCQYDYGVVGNIAKYGSPQPPDYDLDKVNTTIPIDIYYSDNDEIAHNDDTRRLQNLMGSKLSSHHVVLEKFNHFDFMIACNVREVINDCILDQINESENRPYRGTFCNNFKN